MNKKPTYQELSEKVNHLENAAREKEQRYQSNLIGEDRYRNIIETIEDGYYETDLAGNFTFFNDALCRIFGRLANEMMGLNNRDYTTPETAKKIYDVFHDIYANNISRKIIDYEIIRKDGTLAMVETSSSLIKDVSGKAVGFRGIIRDRTERRKMEDALRESEESRRHLLDTMAEGYWEINLNGEFTYVNDAFVKMSGATHEQMIGLRPQNFTALEEQKRINAIFVEVYQTGQPAKSTDYEVTRVDGSKLIVEMSVWLKRNPEGEIIGFCGISRDKTEQRMAERAVSESEAKYRHILDTIEEGYFEMDLKGNRTFCNNALCRMYGMKMEEMAGINYKEYNDPETAKKLFQHFNMIYRTGIASAIVDYRIKRKDGIELFVESSASLMKDDAGNPIGFHGILRDRTEQKRAEISLQQSEEKYRQLVENAHDCIYILQDGVIKFANPRTEEFTGYSFKELTEIPFFELIHRKDRESVEQQQSKRGAKKRPSIVYEFRLISKSGDVLWVELNAVDIQWEGGPATLNFLRDVTLQKRAEAQFLQAQKLEAVGTLAGGIAHDFNNLLMTIQGNASLMLLNLDEEHPHYSRLRSIEQQVQTGADLTRQLLGAAKGGKYEVKPTDVNIIIERTLSLFGRTSKDIVIHPHLEEPIWTVEVDRSQIEQVLLNLYVNAGHAMPAGGDLDVSTQNIMLEQDYCSAYGVAPGKYVRISVTDNGVGMDEATVKRVFDPFFTTKEMGRGTGLGLASAYGIVKNHNGIINIYSEKGEGTTVRIYLPVSEKEVYGDLLPKADIITGSETILFVDDQEAITELGRDLLENMGFRVLTAMSGKEALDLYDSAGDRIDLVILDMIMPGMSGSETFDALKMMNPDVKVLLASGYSINGQARTILDKGCRGFIQKPFGLSELSRKVREVLDGEFAYQGPKTSNR